jgi:hypothetical protein
MVTALAVVVVPTDGFLSVATANPFRPRTFLKQSTFAADGSEYSSKDSSEFEDDDEENKDFGRKYRDEDESPTIELGPVPMSKNSGSRFVAILWDAEISKGKDPLDLHYDHIQQTEDHVMYCRKANLYNETFNTESMVDVLWSLPMYVAFAAAIQQFCYLLFHLDDDPLTLFIAQSLFGS